MARYINEDEFIAWVREHWCLDCQNDEGLRCRACWIDDAIDIVEEAPEADVAPKSEVAREIFEEIEDLLKIVKLPYFDAEGYITPMRAGYWAIDPNDYAELKKKYTGEHPDKCKFNPDGVCSYPPDQCDECPAKNDDPYCKGVIG